MCIYPYRDIISVFLRVGQDLHRPNFYLVKIMGVYKAALLTGRIYNKTK